MPMGNSQKLKICFCQLNFHQSYALFWGGGSKQILKNLVKKYFKKSVGLFFCMYQFIHYQIFTGSHYISRERTIILLAYEIIYFIYLTTLCIQKVTIETTAMVKHFYRFAFIRKALMIPNPTIQTNSTPMPLMTSACVMDHPLLITFLRDSIAKVNGRHLAMNLSPTGIPSNGHTSPKQEKVV